MQLKILQHFNITTDLLSNELIRGARYDVGELNRYLVGMKPLIHISLFDESIDAIYFNFTSSSKPRSKAALNQLIYFPAPSTELLKVACKTFPSASKSYYVVTGHVDQSFLTTSDDNLVERFNFYTAFKMANLKNWNILIASAEGIKPNCSLLNTFLSLGASISTLGKSNEIFSSKLQQKETIALSFQHSIEIYEIKKS